jgi:uncharacterized protein (DUF1015 family)
LNFRPQREINYLWKIDDVLEIKWIQNVFEKISTLYLADDHHRSAAAALLSEENEIFENTAKDYLLSYLISENNVKIYEFQPIGKRFKRF